MAAEVHEVVISKVWDIFFWLEYVLLQRDLKFDLGEKVFLSFLEM